MQKYEIGRMITMPKCELHKGRLETNEGRLDKEIRCYDLLDSLGGGILEDGSSRC